MKQYRFHRLASMLTHNTPTVLLCPTVSFCPALRYIYCKRLLKYFDMVVENDNSSDNSFFKKSCLEEHTEKKKKNTARFLEFSRFKRWLLHLIGYIRHHNIYSVSYSLLWKISLYGCFINTNPCFTTWNM